MTLAPSSDRFLFGDAPRQLLRDARGSTAIEFTFVAPVDFLLIFAIAELALMT